MTETTEVRQRLPEMYTRLLRLARALTRDGTRAYDLAQETCVKALQCESRFQRGTNLWGWLSAVMHSVLRDLARAEQADDERTAVYVNYMGSPDPMPADTHAIITDVERGFVRLTARQREMILRTRIGCESQKAVAWELDIVPSVANKHVRLGLERLSTFLEYA